jgi:hypothetical protein
MRINSGNAYYPVHYIQILVLRYVVINISWETAASIQGRSDCGQNAVRLYMQGDMEWSHRPVSGGKGDLVLSGPVKMVNKEL